MKIKIYRYLFLSVLIMGASAITVFGQYISITEEELALEKSDYQGDIEYVIPKSILIVPIAPPEASGSMDPVEWFRGVYYYQTTRYGLPSISFHYVVTEDGRLIEFDTGLIDRDIHIDNSTIENPLIIAYLTSQGNTKFSPYSREQFSEILLELANKNAIPLENIFIKSLVFEHRENRQLGMVIKDIFIGWQNDLDSIKEEILEGYLPIERTYSIIVDSVDVPSEGFDIGDTIEATIKLKNDGEFPIYKDSGGELILTKIEGDGSVFYVNEDWVTQTQVMLMGDDMDVFRPGETMGFVVKVKVPFGIGTVSDSFEVGTLDGAVISDKPINIDVQIPHPDGDIVEITDTGAGYLRVRAGAGIGYDEVMRVTPGDKYYATNRENGWVEIKVSEDITGWVAGQYTQIFE